MGYFAIDVGDYSIYLSSFLAYNSVGKGEYYNGNSVDLATIDDVSVDFGSFDDPALVSIIADLFPNKISNNAKMSVNREKRLQSSHEVFTPIGSKYFLGMIEDLSKQQSTP